MLTCVRRMPEIGSALLILLLLPSPSLAGRPRPPDFVINQPLGINYLEADQLYVDLRYGNASDAQGLRVRQNWAFLAIPPGSISAEQTLFSTPLSSLIAGRNILSALIPSTASEGDLNNGFLVRHRVFFYLDRDRDGVPDASEAGTPGLDSVDSDSDGLVDGIEARSGFSGGIPGTSRLGAIVFSPFRLSSVRPGRAFPIEAQGLEAINSPAEIQFGGLPSGGILHGLNTGGALNLVVALAPAEIPGSSTELSVTDAAGSAGFATIPVDRDVFPTARNLVMVSSVFSQQFFAQNGAIIPSRDENIDLYLNMLPFGSTSRVLVDASKVNVEYIPNITPDLETAYRTEGGVTTVSTRTAGLISESTLRNVDLLVLLITSPVATYLPSETTAIRDWLRAPGKRLVVVADSCCGPAPGTAVVSANGVLLAIGSNSRFDPTFPTIVQQQPRDIDWETGEINPDPPFTNDVYRLGYLYPGSIIPGPGANIAAVVGVCNSGEVGVTEQGPDPLPILVACRQLEGNIVPLRLANYVVSESVPTGEPMVRFTRIATGSSLQGALSVPAHGYVELPAANQVTVEAEFDGFNPTSATFSGTAAQIDFSSRLLTATIPFDSTASSVGVRLVANAPGVQLTDALVARAKRQRLRTHFVVFDDTTGAPAITQQSLDSARRQTGFELAALCTQANGVVLSDSGGVAIPPLEAPLRVLSDTRVTDTAGHNLILTVDGGYSSQLRRVLLQGNLPSSGAPSAAIPDPLSSGSAAVRVFVARRFLARETTSEGAVVDVEIPQDTETGISLSGQAFFGGLFVNDIPAGLAFDGVFVQASSGDLEAGPLMHARPVVSGLTHELLHVGGGVQDSLDELPGSQSNQNSPVALPAATVPSAMNSFPYFRSLRVGAAAVPTCSGSNLPFGSLGTTELCRRLLLGYTCPDSPIGNGTSTLSIDFTE